MQWILVALALVSLPVSLTAATLMRHPSRCALGYKLTTVLGGPS